MDPGPCGGRQRAGGEGRAALWDGGDLADLEADKGKGARDRLFQRLPDASVQYPDPSVG